MPHQPTQSNLESPSKPSSRSNLNFNSGLGGASSRGALKEDLGGRVHVGVDILEEFLHISRFDKPSVERYVKTLKDNFSLDFEKIREIARDDRNRENEMYPHLLNIFCNIVDSGELGQKSYHRQVVQSTESKFDDEGQNLPHLKPDFVIIEVEPGTKDLVDARRLRRRRVSSFIEVKPHATDSPATRSAKGSVKELTVQAADYASLILSSRPFHIFAIGMVIFGTKFSVGVFDHAGVLFSKEYDMDELSDLNIFVRVVRRLTCGMSLTELGHDPTAQLCDGQTYYQAEFPSFLVSMGGHVSDTRSWTTHGVPLWVSNSLFGRATSVWRATNSQQVKCVLKTAWRDELRLGESEIYARIPNGNPGIAEFLYGGDVLYPSPHSDTARKVDIKSLRKGLGPAEDDHFRNSVLHRVSIRPVGKPLWDYNSVEEFILGLLAILNGHEFLSQECGILHRDISAGNLFLHDEKQNKGKLSGQDGFIADVELASVPPSAKDYRAKTVEPSSGAGTTPFNLQSHSVKDHKGSRQVFEEIDSQGKVKAGPQMTGTAQFMAMEVLEAIVKDAPPVPRAVHHDLESIIWVILSSIYKRALKELDDPKLDVEFVHFFGGTTVKKILEMRGSASRDQPQLRTCIAKLKDGLALGYLVQQFTELLDTQNPPRRTAFTEDAMEVYAAAGGVVPPRSPARYISYIDMRTVLKKSLTMLPNRKV